MQKVCGVINQTTEVSGETLPFMYLLLFIQNHAYHISSRCLSF